MNRAWETFGTVKRSNICVREGKKSGDENVFK